jgi:hypothetical protein
LICFDHLNKNDTIVFRVFHTSHLQQAVQLKGEIVGVGPPKNVDWGPQENRVSLRVYAKTLSSVGELMLMLAVANFVVVAELLQLKYFEPGKLFPFLLLAAIPFFSSLRYLVRGHRLNKRLLPWNARKFERLF